MTTLEQFSGFLRKLRADLKDAYTSRAAHSEWTKEQLSYLEDLDRTINETWLQEIWEALGTAKNRLEALELLKNATMEEHESILKRPHRLQTPRQQRALYRSLEKARKKAEDTGQQLLKDVAIYLKAMGEAFEGGVFVPSFDSFKSSKNVSEALERTIGPTVRWQAVLNECVEHTQTAVLLLQQLEKVVLKGPEVRRKPGPREKPYLNDAFLKLEELFQPLSSRHKAQKYTTLLLYATGVWTNPEHHGTAAKSSQLRRRLSSKN